MLWKRLTTMRGHMTEAEELEDDAVSDPENISDES